MMHKLYVECPVPYTFIRMRRTCASFRLHWNNCREKPLGGLWWRVLSPSHLQDLLDVMVLSSFFHVIVDRSQDIYRCKAKVYFFVCLFACPQIRRKGSRNYIQHQATHHPSPPPLHTSLPRFPFTPKSLDTILVHCSSSICFCVQATNLAVATAEPFFSTPVLIAKAQTIHHMACVQKAALGIN